MKTIRTPPALCPYCGALFTATTTVVMHQPKPEPDDYTICCKCLMVMQFDANMMPQKVDNPGSAPSDSDKQQYYETIKAAKDFNGG